MLEKLLVELIPLFSGIFVLTNTAIDTNAFARIIKRNIISKLVVSDKDF
jgi:hypothetical protein